ncbi:MAG TPA: VOC family protein [Rhizomicrobium sp.]|jgi:catechol 2,3-dioxygenase-like lactoylglutathione lyase family enzyme
MVQLGFGRINQVAFNVRDVDPAEHFYGQMLGLQKIFRSQPHMVFFDCGGMSLLLEKAQDGAVFGGATFYFDCADIGLAYRELKSRGVAFSHPVHPITRQPAFDLYMAFFTDPDGNSLALSQRAPSGYRPVTE